MTPSFNNYQQRTNLVSLMIVKIVKCSWNHVAQTCSYVTWQVHRMSLSLGRGDTKQAEQRSSPEGNGNFMGNQSPCKTKE